MRDYALSPLPILPQCAAIPNCKAYAATNCSCTECNQFFSGASCSCAIAATGCAEKNADGCSCKACANGYKADGAGGCSQVWEPWGSDALRAVLGLFLFGPASSAEQSVTPPGPQCDAIARCKTYSAADCSCTECNQFFSGPTCEVGAACRPPMPSPLLVLHLLVPSGALPATSQCSVSSTGCVERNTDECSCKSCGNGYNADGAGGCTQASWCAMHGALAEAGCWCMNYCQAPARLQLPGSASRFRDELWPVRRLPCFGKGPCPVYACLARFLVQCPAISNCKTYSTTTCACTECNAFYDVTNDTCKVRCICCWRPSA